MKPEFYSLALQPGLHSKGIVDIKVIPKEWISNKIEIDFTTGKVVNVINLLSGKQWVGIQFIPKTYKLAEKPKSNKSGDYFEITVTGTLNRLTAASQQTLLNMKGYELVMIAMDKLKVKKVIGDNNFGMILKFDHQHTSDTQNVELTFAFESEIPAAFYTPPNSSTTGNTLVTEEGDILITEDGNQIEVE